MIDETKVTTEDSVAIYNATNAIFLGLLQEIRELSKKKPDSIMSVGKVSILNRVLEDLNLVLDKEPEGKFLDVLDDENLPQTSDAVLIMCQYETALKAFKNKYYHEVTKNKEEFKIKNRERAKSHYQNGYKEKKRENYTNNRDVIKNKSLYNYYKRNDKIEVFKEKHEEKYKMLVEKGLIN